MKDLEDWADEAAYYLGLVDPHDPAPNTERKRKLAAYFASVRDEAIEEAAKIVDAALAEPGLVGGGIVAHEIRRLKDRAP